MCLKQVDHVFEPRLVVGVGLAEGYDLPGGGL